MLRLVTWDWNGTLLADTQACMDAGNHVINTYGGTPVPRSVYAAKFYFPTADFYCDQGCDRKTLLAGFGQTFHDFYEERTSRCRTRQGAREALSWLKERRVTSVILSNHMQDAIDIQLERLGLTEYFEQTLANTEFAAAASGNSKVNRMRDYFERTGYQPSEAVIIGDSPEDIGIGKTLGMRTIAITDGYFSTPRLMASEPDHIIGSLRESIRIFEEHADLG